MQPGTAASTTADLFPNVLSNLSNLHDILTRASVSKSCIPRSAIQTAMHWTWQESIAKGKAERSNRLPASTSSYYTLHALWPCCSLLYAVGFIHNPHQKSGGSMMQLYNTARDMNFPGVYTILAAGPWRKNFTIRRFRSLSCLSDKTKITIAAQRTHTCTEAAARCT